VVDPQLGRAPDSWGWVKGQGFRKGIVEEMIGNNFLL